MNLPIDDDDDDFLLDFVAECMTEADRRGFLQELPAAPPLGLGLVIVGGSAVDAAAFDDRSPVGDE